MKIAAKFSIFVFLMTFITALAATSFIYFNGAGMIGRETELRLAGKAYHMIDKVDRSLYERRADVGLMASDPVVSSGDSTPRDIAKRLIGFRNAYKSYVSISFTDMNGIVVADTSGLGIGENVSGRVYWEKTIEKGMTAAEFIDYPRYLNTPVVYFTSIVKDKDGRRSGMVVARMPVGKLYHIMMAAPEIFGVERHLKIDLVDKSGLLLYSNTNREGVLKDDYSTFPPVIRSMAGQMTGKITHYDPVKKEEDLCFFARERGYLDFKGNGWTLLVQLPVKDVFRPMAGLRNRTIFLFVTVMVLSVVGTFIAVRKITGPVRKLQYGARALGAGDLDFRTGIKTEDEIGELSGAFDDMAGKLKESVKNAESYGKELEEKSRDLQEKVAELERYYDATVEREFRMKELRQKIEELEARLGKKPGEA